MKREYQNFKDFLNEVKDPSYYQETFNFVVLISMMKDIGGSRDETKNDIRALSEVLTVTLVEKKKGGIQKDAGTKYLSTLKIHSRIPRGSSKDEMMRRIVKAINTFRGITVLRYKEKKKKLRKKAFHGVGSYQKRVQQVAEADYQKSLKKNSKKYSKMKKRLIGKGGQPNVPPFSDKPSFERSKSAPAGFGALEEELIDEAMKSPSDLPDNVVVVIDKQKAPDVYRVYYALKSDPRTALKAAGPERVSEETDVYGHLYFNLGRNFPYEDNYIVTSVRTANGYGPLLYDIAMELAGKSGLKPDVLSVSDEASAVWKYYDTKRDDVQGKLLVYDIDAYDTVMPKEQALKPAENEHLAQVYYKLDKAVIEELKVNNKLVDIYHPPTKKEKATKKKKSLSRFDRLRETIKINIGEKDYLAFETHPELQQKIWNGDKNIRKGVKAALLDIVDEFMERLDMNSIEIEDIILTGSLANYNWSKFSDIDVHIIIDFNKINDDVELVKKFFAAVRSSWNKKHDINVKGHEVEIYIQSDKEPHVSTGVYSLMNDSWLVKPSKVTPKIDKATALKKAKDLEREVDKITAMVYNGSYQGALKASDKLKEKIAMMRKTGLDREGIFSAENLAFKMLRRSDVIQKLHKANIEAYDRVKSIEQ